MLDLLDGLDGLVHGESPSDAIGIKDKEEEASDSADEEDRTDHEYPEDEEWAGISKGGKEHEGGSEHSDNTVQKLIRLVDSSPEKAMSRSSTIRHVLPSNTSRSRRRKICPTSPSTTEK